ncbi:hypothetical protein SSX86_006125 [Deinandra increscens subsp. villosa]|uniref:Uncharacterized protein n=1 Tax=Deinandra increscens subsp. villosa TaxID=3103831 RepID=A0AAP0HAP7_9ASTR
MAEIVISSWLQANRYSELSQQLGFCKEIAGGGGRLKAMAICRREPLEDLLYPVNQKIVGGILIIRGKATHEHFAFSLSVMQSLGINLRRGKLAQNQEKTSNMTEKADKNVENEK